MFDHNHTFDIYLKHYELVAYNQENLSRLGAPSTLGDIKKIRNTKMPDLTAADLNAAVRTIAGSARSMGIEVEGL